MHAPCVPILRSSGAPSVFGWQTAVRPRVDQRRLFSDPIALKLYDFTRCRAVTGLAPMKNRNPNTCPLLASLQQPTGPVPCLLGLYPGCQDMVTSDVPRVGIMGPGLAPLGPAKFQTGMGCLGCKGVIPIQAMSSVSAPVIQCSHIVHAHGAILTHVHSA